MVQQGDQVDDLRPQLGQSLEHWHSQLFWKGSELPSPKPLISKRGPCVKKMTVIFIIRCALNLLKKIHKLLTKVTLRLTFASHL